ncbi:MULTISPECIES: DNA polymerase I [unclassified Desulfovibrio]|uniref:DNA polymerase I n=1 Tax=unclassified Desulfovibrio TaxID=2593640 RepID=UPI0013ED6588|nr:MULTISPECIES: DNA polymerase I [unclassified Desulfovibrio]
MSLKQRLGLNADPVFLMDGTAFIYRGFFANRHMQRSDGFPTNALVVVTRVLLRILREEKPKHFLFLKDGRGKNFRHEIYAGYKANREAMPEDLAKQLPPIERMVHALGLAFEESRGCEADDCIAALAARFAPELPVVIISGDKDLKQCLAPNVYMWDPGSKNERLITEADFEAENGVTPAQWADVQALVGDASDNIPGVPGIGPKTARQIFAICPTLEDIRDHFALLPPKLQDKLRPHLEDMFTWRELTRLSRGVCADIDLAALAVGPINIAECRALAQEYELFALRREIAALVQAGAPHVTAPDMAAAVAGAPEDPAEAARDASGDAPAGAGKGGAQLELGVPAIPAAEEVAEVAQLPPCAGRTVALIWAEGAARPPRVAVGPAEAQAGGVEPAPATALASVTEYAWTGPMTALCAWAEKAAEVAVADLKSLLLAAPFWKGLLKVRVLDLGLAAYLLGPEAGEYGWSRLAARWSDALGLEGRGPAIVGLGMAHTLSAQLAANELTRLYEKLELPLVPVLAAMEERGIAIDPAAFRSFLDDVQRELDTLTREVYAEAGGEFNIRSARKLGEILYERLHLPAPKKTRGGQPSTSQETLERLAPDAPIVQNILQYRKLEKMRSTYLEPLPLHMDAHDRIHTTFNQEATATGRISSSNPNLQNIPVRGPLGKRMRACFVAGPGNALVSADYSQIELRILAHMSQDPALLDAFREGEDIHARTAALVFDLPQDKVLPDQRRMAKTINFGLIYGMGANKLGQELKISTAEARAFIDRYFARLTGLKAFYERVIEGARERGYVVTLAGRRRWLPGILSANGQTAAQAQRQAVNTVIQGSAADVIKLAMIAAAEDAELRRLKAGLVLQVHDELVLELPEAGAREAGARVAALMESVRPGGVTLSVPLVVDWGTGRDWGSAH